MSYILEALRRADAERQQGDVPGLHAQLAALAHPGRGGRSLDSARQPLVIGAGLGLAALCLAAVAWWALGPGVKETTRPAATNAVTANPPDKPSAAPPATPASTQFAAIASKLPPATVASPDSEALVGAAPLPATAGARAARVPPATAPATPAPTVAAQAAPAQPVAANPAPVPAPTPAPTRLPTLAELPEALRRELPALTLGGAMYAEQPGLRIVIINSQVFHEGDNLAPGLQVQQIRLKSVVFKLRGQPFEMPL